jgi:alpha-tubulin suppressor-like RCC1 family protein
MAPVPLGSGFATETWISFDCGHWITAAIDTSGKLFTWGTDTAGELAQAASPGDVRLSPTPVLETGSGLPTFVQVAAGRNVLCARSGDKRMFCAGEGSWGQTGDDSFSSYDVLTELDPMMTNWEWGPFVFADTVVAGINTATYPLRLLSWGLNDKGQGGSGSPGTNWGVPTAVTEDPDRFRSYSVGGYHACGMNNAGSVYCIGEDAYGKYSGASVLRTIL